jgi:hypothetical protein
MNIRIEKTYKGEPPSEIILASENTSCGGKFAVGSELLLYAQFIKELWMWKISSILAPAIRFRDNIFF